MKAKSEPRWITFVELKAAGKLPGEFFTGVWTVFNKRDGEALGLVQWFSRWRCYIFCPEPGTVFSNECLEDLADFPEAKTKEYKGHCDEQGRHKPEVL